MLFKSAVLACLLAELGLARQAKRQDVAPSPVLSSISIPPLLSTGTGAAAPAKAGPTGLFLNTSIPAVAAPPQVSTLTELATVTSLLSNNVTTTQVITTERTVTADAAPIILQPQVIIVSQVTFFTFTSALGGACPAVQQGQQGGFVVGGQQFEQFQSACNAACGMQFTQCQSIAGQNFHISQCQTQLIACQGAAKTATVTVSVPTTVTQTVLLPQGPNSGAAGLPSSIAGTGGSVITTTTLPPDAAATVGTGGVSFVTVTATPAAPPAQTAAPQTSVLTTTIAANPEQPNATPVVSVITVTRQPGAEPSKPADGGVGEEGGASGKGGSVVTSAVVSTLPAVGGQPPIVSTIYITKTAEAVSSVDAIAGSSPVVTTLPAKSEGGQAIVSTVYVSAPPPAATKGAGGADKAGSVVTSAIETTLPAQSAGGQAIVKTIYVTATAPAASAPPPKPQEPKTSVLTMTLGPATGSPVVSLITVTIPPAAPTDSAQAEVSTSALTSTIPAEGTNPPHVTTVYITAQAPAATSAPPHRVITITVGSLTGVVTVSDAQSTASATTVASALPSAGTGGSVGNEGSQNCPAAVTVTETVSSCPTAAVTSVLTQTVSVVPAATGEVKRTKSDKKHAAEYKRDEFRHSRRHVRAFGL
ncbi:uncharacterized protein ColSpa_05234 [Colletotrichum spaethianum]|uniref:Uncharacterized protein n=1 Tax=Colletotrichum spaethianum TaxID=700344 RepID=A0AA37P1M2_9PEZI|nr:uncharacterized protein ColSpa_05234 [Colletotrichum spaethianum]GKT45053.1 hypothetical protein ColSpa_05234 [Colletotrichum spaethianum]